MKKKRNLKMPSVKLTEEELEQRNAELKIFFNHISRYKNGFTVLDIAGDLRWGLDKVRKFLMTGLSRKHVFAEGRYFYLSSKFKKDMKEWYNLEV